MSISVSYTSNLTTTETLSDSNISATSKTVSFDGANGSGISTASSTAPCTMRGGGKLTLSSGAGSIDLTAIPGVNGTLQDGTGLKVQFVKLKNLGESQMWIYDDITNGYQLHGGGYDRLPVGGESLHKYSDGLADIDGTHKIIGVEGSGSDQLQYEIVMG